jgi:hypothetical protein
VGHGAKRRAHPEVRAGFAALPLCRRANVECIEVGPKGAVLGPGNMKCLAIVLGWARTAKKKEHE